MCGGAERTKGGRERGTPKLVALLETTGERMVFGAIGTKEDGRKEKWNVKKAFPFLRLRKLLLFRQRFLSGDATAKE